MRLARPAQARYNTMHSGSIGGAGLRPACTPGLPGAVDAGPGPTPTLSVPGTVDAGLRPACAVDLPSSGGPGAGFQTRLYAPEGQAQE